MEGMQSCRARGNPLWELLGNARKAGLRRAGSVDWTRVMLCRECIARARATGYEVWEPAAPEPGEDRSAP
jgi:hypothetical protein